ncbi:MAG TPA: glycoside hydrolase family 140 protein [Chitinophagaceae bacterium]|nr:glycoside hydrolase family 140 protein [Chitinophagaceae bacterium]
MRRNLLAVFALFLSVLSYAQVDHGRIRLSADKFYLQYEDGTPFFWLGDTGWELFHRLRDEEISMYLENRRQKGFNLVQAVILAEFDGLRKPDPYGNLPLIDLDPEKPNEKYFARVDKVVKMAATKNMIMGLLPTWGDKVAQLWGEGPVVFNERNAYSYGLFLGKRYSSDKNLIWILGGDRPAIVDSHDWRPIWRSMARGILEGTNGKALITYHISGGSGSTSQQIHNEPWLNVNMMQSGHGGGHDVPVWEWIQRDRALMPSKPTLDSEPNYEDHPVNPWPKWDPANGYFRDYDVRKQIYRSVFAGGCGVTYGHHSIWQFWSPREEKINHADRYWTDALDRPGAIQAGYLRWLIESRSPIGRIPDQSMIIDGQGVGAEYMTSFRDEHGRYGMIYLPIGKKIRVDASFIRGSQLVAWWFDPRRNLAIRIGKMGKSNSLEFIPPATGGENDWVLVIDDASEKYSEPGKRK